LAAQLRQLPPPGNPLRQAALVELVKIDLTHQWQAGRHGKVEAYLKALPELGTAETVAAELLSLEYRLRVKHGQPVDLDFFLRPYPRQAAAVRRQVSQSLETCTVAATPDPSARATHALEGSSD